MAFHSFIKFLFHQEHGTPQTWALLSKYQHYIVFFDKKYFYLQGMISSSRMFCIFSFSQKHFYFKGVLFYFHVLEGDTLVFKRNC